MTESSNPPVLENESDIPEIAKTFDATDEQGRVLAGAEVRNDERPGTVRASVHVASGHRPPGTSAGLVDRIVDDPDVRRAERVKAVLPKGDSEALLEAQERLADAHARTAGASVIVEGDTPRTEPPDTESPDTEPRD